MASYYHYVASCYVHVRTDELVRRTYYLASNYSYELVQVRASYKLVRAVRARTGPYKLVRARTTRTSLYDSYK